MTTKYAQYCGCPVGVVMGRKTPERCDEHGNLFVGKALGYGKDVSAPRSGDKPSITRHTKKRSEPPRDWTLAIAKKEEEGRCRVCNSTEAFGLECAHILGRKYDQPITPGLTTLLVLPDRIVPLCSEETNGRCHRRYDAHELDLLPYLTAEEQAQAVLDAGSVGLALKRISPGLEMAA